MSGASAQEALGDIENLIYNYDADEIDMPDLIVAIRAAIKKAGYVA